MSEIGSFYSKKVLLALTAWLLMSIFLSIPIVQSLHSHNVNSEHSNISKQQTEVSSHLKCEICDYLSHTLKKQGFQSYAIETIAPAAEYFVRKSFFVCAIFEQCIQAFTNKGPPLYV